MRTFLLSLLAIALLPLASAALPGTILADDAGSGRDAPQGLIPRTPIGSGVLYHGAIAIHDVGDGTYFPDLGDSYAFQARAGDDVELRFRGPQSLYSIQDAAGNRIDSGSFTVGWFEWVNTRALTPADGTYYVHVTGHVPQPYCFGLGINGPAPIVAYLAGVAECGVE